MEDFPKQQQQGQDEEDGIEITEIDHPVDFDALKESDASITALARKEFDRPEDMLWTVATPVIIRNLSLKKDASHVGCCAEDPTLDGLQEAPNFASAILGKWLAGKMGLGGRKRRNRAMSDGSTRRKDFEHVFQNVSALLIPGEVTLLLGPSSSGKTTLLQTVCDLVSNKMDSANNVEGTLLLGSLEPSEWKQNLTRTTAFVDQTDLTLTPILTVDETVRFARSCAETDRDDLDERIAAVLQLAGLDHVKSTVVGDADIRGVSGGQKRRVKLLEMAVGNQVRLFALDEVTNGLDAATALEICKLVKVAAETTGVTGIVTLLQPSPEVFHTFHRLILLTQDGQVAYSGKTNGALPHFESLGLTKPKEMSEAEFLLRCATQPTAFGSGETPSKVSSSAQLAEFFHDSEAGRHNLEELNQVEAQSQESLKGEVMIADFAQPFYKQIKLLMGRGFKLVARNPASVQRVLFAIIFGAFIGTLFLNTGSDAKGTTVRAGYVLTLLFLVFINSTSAPLNDLFNDRLTFYTHRRATFYRTSSYYISQALCSAVVPLVEAFFLSLISFFCVGMNSRGGWGFAYFWAVFSLVTLCGAAISRILAYGLPSNDIAQSLAPAVLLLFVLSAGYSPQYLQLPTWLRWLAWISPCAYCYEGVIVNEVWGRNVGDENGSVWAQENLGIPRIPYQDAVPRLSSERLILAFDAGMLIALTAVFEVLGCCLLHYSQNWFGPTTKRYQVASGMSLTAPPWCGPKKGSLEASKGDTEDQPQASDQNEIPRAPPAHLTSKDIVYEVDVPIEEPTSVENTTEKEEAKSSSMRSENDSLSPIQENPLENESRDVLITAREYGQAGKGAAREWAIKRRLGEDALSTWSSVDSRSSLFLSTSNLPPPEPGRLRLLSGITASFEPGTMTALMGSSGAGKSTLLDVLAGYKTGGYITGDIQINGQPKTDETWRSIAGYCEQVDLHNPAMTVRESIIFAARLRLRPFSLADGAKIDFAQQILGLLELEEFSDMLVGDEAIGEGLPKHARKRLTVGVELAANPSILFADEPTSGLDSLSASVVVSCLERAAKQRGLTVVCTIHQPSREVFAAFDNLLLLRKGGECVYNGPLDILDEYLQSAPNSDKFAIPPDINPADHVLSVFCQPSGGEFDWGIEYNRSEMAKVVLTKHTSCSCDCCTNSSGVSTVDSQPLNLLSELWIVTQRQMVAHWRTPTYMAVRFWWTVVANLLVSIVYFGSDEVFNIIGAIFFYVNIATVPLTSAIVPLIVERAVFYREVASGTYRRKVYGMAVQIAEVPFNMGAAVCSFVIFYFMVGLKREAERIIYFVLVSLAMYWILPTFGQLFAFLSPNIGAAIGMGSLLLTLFTLTMGFLIPASEIPGWYIWIYWINPLRYPQQGLVVNEVGGTPEGDAILSALTWSYSDRWWYCYAAVLMFGVAASVGVVVSTRISWLKR